ncbi:hypothetical protein [Sphingosinicella sp. BN140058]|uniref:hypothetical protein n=1 Tax=Sphingosinicella sp. BN140058 TaxID=1892855 RepID=UPI0010116B2B|nr:hypothetical protein [Sphingosinicella sp. BN140058]QAY80478.1 hypothetical protein ETR14_27965 [Sphingosinicella sp. BN140058]
MTKAILAIQCEHEGQTGTFLFTRSDDGGRTPVSPILADCVALFDWASQNGWAPSPGYHPSEPTGVYIRP